MPSNYVQSVSKRIISLKLKETNPERLKAILESNGGTSKFNAFVAVIIWLLAIAIVVGSQGGFDVDNHAVSSLQAAEDTVEYVVDTERASNKKSLSDELQSSDRLKNIQQDVESHLATLRGDVKESKELPECKSSQAEKELRRTFEKNGTLELLDWNNLIELAYSEDKAVRTCAVEVALYIG